MAETWAIVDSRDVIMARCEEGAECSDADQELIGGVPPYRVAHLVEAGAVEPDLAEVVKAVHSWEKEPQPGLPDELTDAELRMFESLRRVKPHQLRACGIEVNDA